MAARRASAEKRQEAYDKLTLDQKLAKLPPEPHAAKERAKLLRKLEASKKKVEPVQEQSEQTEVKKPKKNNKKEVSK